jgi:hypothetical protein
MCFPVPLNKIQKKFSLTLYYVYLFLNNLNTRDITLYILSIEGFYLYFSSIYVLTKQLLNQEFAVAKLSLWKFYNRHNEWLTVTEYMGHK